MCILLHREQESRFEKRIITSITLYFGRKWPEDFRHGPFSLKDLGSKVIKQRLLKSCRGDLCGLCDL